MTRVLVYEVMQDLYHQQYDPDSEGLESKLRAATGGEFRRGQSIEGLYKGYQGIVSLRLYTRYTRLV